MTLFLLACLGLSCLILFIGFAMDAAAIRQRINGANGLPFLAALWLSLLLSIAAAAVTLWQWGFAAALLVLAVSALWHWGAFHLLVGALQRKANRAKAAGDMRSSS